MVTSEKSDGEWSITVPQDSNSNFHEISYNEREWLYTLENSRGSIGPSQKGKQSRSYIGSSQKGEESTGYIGSSQKPKIQMVPKLLREIPSNIRCYEPLVVSIGPFHHRKSELQPMEKYKELLAFEFADQAPCSVSIYELYRRVKNIMPNVMECYAEDWIKKYSYEELAQMMFLDGCFILQYLHCIVTGKKLKMKSHDIAFIRRDLFLLENQLPFEVLQVLMSCKFKNNEGMEMIKKFILREHNEPSQGEGPSHTTQEHVVKTPLHLLELLRTCRIDPKTFSKEGCYLTGELCSYRSAKELRKAGIHLRPGKSRHLSGIEFKSFCCSSHLTIPPITIDDSTKSEFLNLVAYEACPDTPDDFGVTSYLCFLDSLIDHAEDVEKLRSNGILLNYLGSDKEVADLFNEITRDLVPNPHAFKEVKNKIVKHYECRTKIWIAEWKNTHFTNPWTVFAFIAAIFVICLQVSDTSLASIQAHYAAHPK